MSSDESKESAITKFEKVQATLISMLNERVSSDMNTAIYIHDDDEVIEVSTVPLCSYGLKSRTTVWAWTNPDIPLPEAYDESAFSHLSESTGETAFLAKSPLTLSETEEKHLLALATKYLEGHGLLTQQHEDTVWYLLVTGIHNDSEPEFAEDSIRLALYWLFSRDRLSGFNQIRARHPDLSLNFSNNDLRGEPQPWKGDLHTQPAIDHGFISEHQARCLDGINLSRSTLSDSNLRSVSLQGANFTGTNLVNADLSMTDLRGADLSGAFLNGTNLFGANLEGVRFHGAELGRTLLVDVDLSKVEGLDNVHHATGSEIAFSSMVKSNFDISEKFLRSAGVSMGLLDDLRRGKRFATKYSTCFLSYSTKDAEFAELLYYSLQEAGVRVYWDRTSLTAGEYLDEQLSRAIKEHDMTIAVFSTDSIESVWLEREVKIALHYKPNGFTPIRIIDIPPIREFVESKQIKPDIVNRYPIMDFSGWHNEEEFERCRNLLLKSIRR